MTDAKTTVRALVLALALAAMMIVGSFAAMADGSFTTDWGDAATQTISIAGLENGDKVTFYKVLEWTGSDKDPATVGGWRFVEPFKTAFDVVTGTEHDYGAAKLAAAVSAAPEYKLMITDALAGEIARALNTDGVDFDPVASNVPEVSGTATYSFAAVGADATKNDGLYMAIITPANQGTQYNPVFVHLDHDTITDSYTPTSSADYYNKSTAKKSTHTIEKESHNTNDYTNNNNEEATGFYATTHDDGDTTKVGDILKFKVTTKIPGYGDVFTGPFFTLSDTLKDLELVKDATYAFTVTVGGQSLAETSGDTKTYTTSAADKGTAYDVVFDADYLKTIKVPTDLTIEYYAKVTSKALANINKEKNTVELNYSHDVSTETDGRPGGYKKWEKDVTNHYTFTIDANNLVSENERIGESSSEVIKIGVDSQGNPIESTKQTVSNVTTTEKEKSPLAGAKFSLYKTGADGKRETGATPILTNLQSDANGRIKIEGLDAGKYVLVETQVPAGYVTISDDLAIEIKATIAEQEITEWYDQAGNWYATQAEAEAAEIAKSGNTDLAKKVGSFTYKAKELKSYQVIYGGSNNGNEIVSSYTFNHIHESEGEIKWKISTSAEAPASIPNTKGVELPSTGGIGTTIFYVGGSLMVLAAAILLITKRRMGVED